MIFYFCRPITIRWKLEILSDMPPDNLEELKAYAFGICRWMHTDEIVYIYQSKFNHRKFLWGKRKNEDLVSLAKISFSNRTDFYDNNRSVGYE